MKFVQFQSTQKEFRVNILKASTTIVCVLTLVTGCGSSVPDCSDSDTKELVLQISAEKYTFSTYNKNKQDLSIENIRVVDKNDKTGSYTCEAEIDATYSADKLEAVAEAAEAAVLRANANFVKADADANDARAYAAKAADAVKAAYTAREAQYAPLSVAMNAALFPTSDTTKVSKDEFDKLNESYKSADALYRAAKNAANLADNDPKIIAANEAAYHRDQALGRAKDSADFLKNINDMPPLKVRSIRYTTELTSEGKLYVTLRFQ